MCVGSPPSAPTPPPRAPEAAATPTTPSRRGAGVGDAARRRRAAGQDAGGAGVGTILTGARGVTDGGTTATKTLLGQ